MENTACGSTRISCVRGCLKLSGMTSHQGSGFPDLPGQGPGTRRSDASGTALPSQPSAVLPLCRLQGAGQRTPVLAWRRLVQPRASERESHGWTTLPSLCSTSGLAHVLPFPADLQQPRARGLRFWLKIHLHLRLVVI